MRRFLVIGLLALCCLTPAMLAFAQSAASATITGDVVDPQGLVIANAKVTATNVATGIAHSTNTTGSGDYTLPNLPPGIYNVKVEAAKFAVAEAKSITLNVGDQRDLKFKMTVTGGSQVVEVTATAPLIETTKTDVSSVIDNQDLERMPTLEGAGAARAYRPWRESGYQRLDQ
jgi:Carboxypeptidase regulatory-like domain